MANTTNYNWETPDDTDLVKDGAAAIRTLGSSVDTTTKNLNPQTTTGALAYRSATANVNTALPIGTSGQILAVSGGVPAWINNDQGDITEVQAGTGISVASGTGPVPIVTNTVATAIDAKGDLIVGTGADAFSRLAVGTNTYILTADSAEATGLKWAAPSSTPTFVGWSLTKSAGQNVSNVTTTAITFDTETFDTNAFHTGSDAKITIPSGKGGKYLIVATISFSTNTTNGRFIGLYKNGSLIKIMVNAPGTANDYVRIPASTIVDVVATDYLELKAYQDSGSTLTILEGTTETTYSGTFLGA